MTSLHVSDGEHETLTEAVARRLRGQLAERLITHKEFGERTGWGRMTIYRRLTGETPLDTNDLERIEQTTGIPTELLITGHEPQRVAPTIPLPAPRQLRERRRGASAAGGNSTSNVTGWLQLPRAS